MCGHTTVLWGSCGVSSAYALCCWGFLFLGEQNSPYIILSILGCMVEAIVAMVVYVTVIEKKYRTR